MTVSSIEQLPSRQPKPKRLYRPGDDLWQLNREMLMALSGPRSVLLELAHPLVAAGVSQHSKFKSQPMARLRRTLQTMIRFSFGGTQTVSASAQHMVHCHSRVAGQLQSEGGQYAEGQRYHANNPELRLWVWATLVDGVFASHDQFIRPLTLDEKERYYQASHRMLPYMGVPMRVVPPTVPAFDEYVAHIINNVLYVTDEARDVADAIFSKSPIGRAFWVMSQPGLGLMPASIRADFGIAWNDRKEARYQQVSRLLRTFRGWAPAPLVVWPQALWVEWTAALGINKLEEEPE